MELVHIRTRVSTPMLCNKEREEKCQRYKTRSRLLVDLVKGSGIVETAVPDLIDNSSSVCVVLAAWPVGD